MTRDQLRTATPRHETGWTPRLLLSFIGMVSVLELSAANYLMSSTALPIIDAHFHTTQGAWLSSSVLLAGAVFCPLSGRLADLHGKRRMLLVSVGLALAGSVLSALAPTYAVMLLGRVLQGGMVSFMFLTYSLMRDVYPQRTLAMAVSVGTAGMGLINIPAPWITAWLLDTWSFRALFWFMAVGLALAGALIASTTPESTLRVPARLDWAGAILLGAGIAGMLIAVSFGSAWGWTSARTIGCLLGGGAVTALWAVLALRTAEPLVDLRFFRRRPVLFTALSGGISAGTTAIFNVLVPSMVMTPAALGLGYGFTSTLEGNAAFVAPVGAAAVVGGFLVGTLVSRVSPRTLMAVGHGLLTLGALLVALWHASRGGLIIWSTVEGLGLGTTYAAVPNLVISAVPRELQGSMASMVQVFQGGLSAVFPVIVFAVLNAHIGASAHGYVFFTNGAYTMGFAIAAGTALLGVVTACALPRAQTGPDQTPDETDSTTVAVGT